MIPESIVLFAGRGDYPQCVFDGARAAGVKRIRLVAVRGLTSWHLRHAADECVTFGVGELERALAWLEQCGTKHMILAGQITPMALFTTRFDRLTRELLNSLKVKNAHTIFGEIIHLCEARGITVLPSSCFMGAHLPKAGLLTQRAPDDRESADVAFGMKAAMGICDLDVGQTILLKDGMILAVEAFEGTNAALRRGAKLGGAGAVMIKVAKASHDMRFDIPVFGEHTIRLCHKLGISTVAFQAERLIMINQPRIVELANRYGISLVSIDSGLPSAPIEP